MNRTTRRTILSIVAVVAIGTGIAACGSSGGSDDASSASSTTTTEATSTTTEASTTSEEPTETTEPADTTIPGESLEGTDTETSELDSLTDGDHYGYIAGLENGTVEGQAVSVIRFDPVEYFTGAAAVAAAKEDGAIPADQDYVENDVYIRNSSQSLISLAVVPEAQIYSLAEGGSASVPSSIDEVWKQDHLFRINVGNVRAITTVSGIDAVYLP